MNRKQLVVGGVMLVIGVAAYVIGQSMHSSGYHTAMWESAKRGDALMQTANFVRFGGVGIGAIGAVVALVSFLKAGSARAS